MLNFTRIPAPRVMLVDPQTGVVSNEWFRFFNNLYSIAYAATGNVTPGTYGSATAVPQITVDAFGAITGLVDVPIALDASQIVSGTIASARISGPYTGITGVGTLIAGTWNASTIATSYGGTGLSSYTVGDTLYYATGSALSKLSIGANTYINTSSGTAPQWTDPSTITIGKATNIVGGAANRIAYQTAADTTGFIVAPTVSNTYLEWSGTAFQWTANPLGTVTSVSVVSANGLAGTVATATTTPAITLSTTVTGLLKGNGTAISAASSGTDYAPATSGTSILYGNGAGGFSNVTIGTGVSFAGGTLSATGLGGTVTSVSGTGTVNGITLTGTVTSSGSLTLGGTLTGIGNSQLTNSTISGVALGGSLFNLTAGTGVTFSTGTTYNGSAAITINATGLGGTVTSVAALTLGTAGTDLSSTVANSTTTPVITLNVPTASATNRGALSAADWTTFNNKAPGVTFTSNYIPYGQGTTTLNQSAGLQFDGTNFTTTGYATATSFRPSSSTVPTNGLYLPATNSVGWATNSTERMRINASGNVGIGTASPNVSGQNTDVKLVTIQGANPYWGAVEVSNSLAIAGTLLGFYGFTSSGAAAGYTFPAYIGAWLDSSGTATKLGGSIRFFTQADNNAGAGERMRIFSTGGVSIGNTTDPGANNLSVTNSVTAVSVNTQNTFGYKNLLINAGFTINQRGYVSAATLAAGSFGHDRWKAGASGGNYTFTQLASSTTITIASGKSLIQVIEDKNVNGTSFVLSWAGTAQARYAVNSATPAGSYANSPILITGQTVGTTMSVEFNTGTLSNPQLELGSTATSFDVRDYGRELIMCQRYYERLNSIYATCANAGFANSYASYLKFTVTKRDTPTVTIYSAANLAGTSGSATWYPGGVVAAATTESVSVDIYIFARLGTSTYNLCVCSATIVSEL